VERGWTIRRGHKGGTGCCWLIQWTPSASTVRKCFQSDCNTFWIESLLQSDITCLVPSPTLPSLIRRPTVRRLASTRCGPCSLRRHSERLLGAEFGLPSLTWESALGIERGEFTMPHYPDMCRRLRGDCKLHAYTRYVHMYVPYILVAQY